MSSEESPVALLVEAVNSDDAKLVEALLDCNPEQRNAFTPFAGGTWLHYAARQGSNAVIRYLLASGMDINVGDRWDGASALCFAAHENQVNTTSLLLQAGIDLDVSSSIRNPLFSAIVGRSPEIVKMILEAGVDVSVRYNSPTMNNMDAISFALMRGERECAEMIARWRARGDEVMVQELLVEADKIAEQNAHA